MNVKKLLVIRFSSIGDIVLTTAVIRCVKKQVPEISIHYLTKVSFAPILQQNPFLDKVWLLENDLDKLFGELKNEQFDFVADLHHNLRSLRVKTALGKPSAAFNKLNFQKWLMVNFKYNRLPNVHIVDRYMKTVESLGVTYDGGGLDYFIPENDQVRMDTLPAPWNNGYIAFVIGAKHATKRLPPDKITGIINKIHLPVLLLGGKEDAHIAKEIENNSGGFALNTCGNYNLSQSASLVKQARFVITHDTGLMHVAAAFRKRIISVWGNTIPGFGMTPFLPAGQGESVIFENNHLNCRPCSKIGYEKCPLTHFKCMVDIDTDALAAQAIKWWNDKGRG